MTARVIDGKAIAERWRADLARKARDLRARGIHPCLAAVSISDDPAWAVYRRNQAKACDAIGIDHRVEVLPPGSTQEDLNERIEALNVDPRVHGIIVQSPLPAGFNELQAQAQLSPDKDVEAVGPANLGLVLAGRGKVAPCTAVAAVALAREALGELRGVEAVVVGASAVVGRPIAQLLVAAGATVTTCHIDTRDVARHTRAADLVVVAVGKAGLLKPDMVKPGASVIDVGINRARGADGKETIVGDVDPGVAQVAGALTPVPGGVGALTTTVLLEATLAAAERLADEQPALEGAALTRLIGGADLAPDVADRLATLLSRHLIHTPGLRPLRGALERRLAAGVMVVDGGSGSELIARGVAPAAVTDANLDHPDLVREVHRAYLAAGAQLITANTFGANRWRLHGNRERAVRLAGEGVRLAREAVRLAGSTALVAGSLGPLGPVVGAELEREAAEQAFAEVALAMADAGADAIAIETMPSNLEAAAALAGVRRVCRLPVLVCRSLDRDDPFELAELARLAEAGGAVAVGINCAAGPRALLPVAARLVRLTRLPVVARPNAGFPSRVDGRPVYHLRPEYLVEQARGYVAAGVGVLGGCCGVGPSHIAALAAAFRDSPLPPRPAPEAPRGDEPTPAAPTHPLIVAACERRFPALAFVPARLSPAASGTALARLAGAGADAVGLLAGWPGSGRPSQLPARLRNLQDECRRPAVLELIADGLTLGESQDLLLSAHLLGIRLVLIDSGVFAAESRAEGARGCDPLDLLATIKRLNAGRDLAGGRIEQPTAFAVGVRLSVAAAAHLPRWLAHGPDFLTVQPVYRPASFRALMAEIRSDLPLFAEILLLPDAATADELDNELPALSVPRRLKELIASDPDQDVKGVGRFLDHWRSRLAGVCVMLPDQRTVQAERVLGNIRNVS